jgi:hypothetical protein
MTSMLLSRVQDDFFPMDDFSMVLYHLISRYEGFNSTATADIGLPLLDPQYRARHFLTMLIGAQAGMISFAFVVIYRPQALFCQDTDTPFSSLS